MSDRHEVIPSRRPRKIVKARKIRLDIDLDLDFLGLPPIPLRFELDEILQLDELGEKIEKVVEAKVEEIKDAMKEKEKGKKEDVR